MILKEIVSSGNDTVKLIKKLQTKSKARYEEKLYVVEGLKQVRELETERIDCLIVSHKDKLETLVLNEDQQVIVVSEKLFGEISTDPAPQGIMALVHMRQQDFKREKLDPSGLYLMLDTIQDPGNLGTIIRVADAVGIQGIFMNASTVDCYNPKVVKSTMGSLEHIDLFVVPDLFDIIEAMKQRKIKVFGAYLEGSISHFEADYKGGTCVIIGNEGNGIRDEIIALADSRIRIPMPGKSESLNASVATSVILYEALRQRM